MRKVTIRYNDIISGYPFALKGDLMHIHNSFQPNKVGKQQDSSLKLYNILLKVSLIFTSSEILIS